MNLYTFKDFDNEMRLAKELRRGIFIGTTTFESRRARVRKVILDRPDAQHFQDVFKRTYRELLSTEQFKGKTT